MMSRPSITKPLEKTLENELFCQSEVKRLLAKGDKTVMMWHKGNKIGVTRGNR